MFYTVYKVLNLLTGEFYIGVHKTDNPNDDYLGSGKLIRAQVAQHGRENFSKEILATFQKRRDAYDLERLVVEPLLGTPGCLNLHPGGHGGFGYINTKGGNPNPTLGSDIAARMREDPKFKEQLVDKQRQARAKSPAWQAHLQEWSNTSWVGRKHTDATKLLISLRRKGQSSGEANSQHGTCWVTKAGQNKKISLGDLPDMVEHGWSRGRCAPGSM